jgi:hypothetical protein
VRKRFFFEKKKQKTSAPAGLGTSIATSHSKRKFFASFFQKRSASFPFPTPPLALARHNPAHYPISGAPPA